MKLRIVCHLAAFFVSDYVHIKRKGDQMTNNSEFHALLLKGQCVGTVYLSEAV